MKKPRANKEVWVSVGMTLNLGSYESARVDIESGKSLNSFSL